MIVVNFKNFVSGEKAVNLAKICKRVADETGIKIIVAVQVEDLDSCLEIGIECWSQKPEDSKYNFSGTLLNHSDYRITEWPNLDPKLKVCLCTKDVLETEKLISKKPDIILYEPLELIGSATTSVALSKPEIISEVSKICKNNNIPLIVGAGVKSRKDVMTSLQMGAMGVGVSSAVVKAIDPEKELRELAEAF